MKLPSLLAKAAIMAFGTRRNTEKPGKWRGDGHDLDRMHAAELRRALKLVKKGGKQ